MIGAAVLALLASSAATIAAEQSRSAPKKLTLAAADAPVQSEAAKDMITVAGRGQISQFG